MSLEVVIYNAINIPNVKIVGKTNPYVELEFLGLCKKTEVKKSELEPVWNEQITFSLKGKPLTTNDQLKIYVKDWERIGRNRLLGASVVQLKDLIKKGMSSTPVKYSLALKDGCQRETECKVNLCLEYKPPNSIADGSGKIVNDYNGNDCTLVNISEDDDDDDLDYDDFTSSSGSIASKRSTTKKGQGKRKIRGQLSAKSQDFQIRIKVVEARQLSGSNICPVTRIKCYNQTKQTRVQKSTNSPFWNEVFFFNLVTSPAELFDEIISFSVYNSRKLRSDAFIGSFKCDIGMIYEESKHAILNKWLLLSDPDDTMAGAKGYLKISAVVLGPGDEAPLLQTVKTVTSEEAEDIESNLLCPAGVQLRPATFILKLYRAEDLPRMDSNIFEGIKNIMKNDERDLVDPYFVISFAGKEVKSKIIYSCDHPEWNEELRLGLRFPSMCERIKLQLFDWDTIGEDDKIGTEWLCTAEISALGNPENGEEGFLPTFGPCYVNFYGSTREYSQLANEYDDLNLGKGEGVAFRGRALIELQTVLGEFPESSSGEISQEDMTRVQKFMRRRKFKLHAAFFNATMISAIDAPIEFEISIGNYGNKLDKNVPPCSSTTQPTNPVFDGSYYYFLPWGENKPCCVVDCHWEDVSYRLETLNFFIYIIDRLQSNLDRMKMAIKANLSLPELAQLMISLLDQFIADAGKPLPDVRHSNIPENNLDKELRLYREVELKNIYKEAIDLRDNATEIEETLHEVENYMAQLKNLANEPQNSIPDVIIWMISGETRIAYYRCPAHLLLWSPKPEYRGKYCGKLETIELKYPSSKSIKEGKSEIPAMLRMKLWLGHEKNDKEWHTSHSEGELAVFAETYENQVSVLGKWTNKGPTLTRPKWSDVTGKVKLDQENFVPPAGWKWEGEWYISPELSLLYDKDSGHSQFLDDVYERQARYPAGTWGPDTTAWSDVKGDYTPAKDEFVCPNGWEWKHEWEIDYNRAVDELGWEYCVEATIGGYGPVEKNYHLCRRRRWVRSRILVKTEKNIMEEQRQLIEKVEGWEYAPLFKMKFHNKERKIDMVRRRRWHRKMVCESASSTCLFQKPKSTEEDYQTALTVPRVFLTCRKPYRYQLRAYMYQARDLLAGDSTGLSDPFARVTILHESSKTDYIKQSVCPTWDQTLIFDSVNIHGDPKEVSQNPPQIMIEMFDHNKIGKPDFLGRTRAFPMVKINTSDSRTPVLQWFSINKGDQYAGELLAAFELIFAEQRKLPFFPPKKGKLFMVPSGIRPVMQRTGIEVMCWGVRNMKKFQLASVTSPSVEFEIGGHVQSSTIIQNTKRNSNFLDPVLFFDVMLPKEELYTPPLNIKVRDNRPFGRKPLVGIHSLKSLESFRFEPINFAQGTRIDLPSLTGRIPTVSKDTVINMHDQEPATSMAAADDDIDWWSKYYASIGDTDKCKFYLEYGYDTLNVYDTELEKVEPFEGFSDFCHTFEFNRGKSIDEDESNIVGELKGTFRIYTLPNDPNEKLPLRYFSNLPPSEPEECIIRVYLIRAMDLQPNDPSGLADPYVNVMLGKKKMSSKDNYIPNNLNPIFGRLFEIKALLPLDKDLLIQVKDYDLLSADDVIGETTIDLENRYLSKYRATVGLPKTYCVSGPNEWRDSKKPIEILEDLLVKMKIPKPEFQGNNAVKIGNQIYHLSNFETEKPTHTHLGSEDQRLALYLLHDLPPALNNPLVEEHVETRPLYNPLQPGIEQGKLQLWVDIFPKSMGEPGPPVDVSPRTPKKYELRIVVWNTMDVILDDESITGELMSDIYVKCWIAGIDDKQETDIHYRSLTGEGNFNWRLVFPFDYIPAEESILVKKKENFWSLNETEFKLPLSLVCQIWDNDLFSADDFLGTVDLNLTRMPKPAKTSNKCKLSQLPDVSNGQKDVPTINLFEARRVKGFWPCYNDETGERVLTGKVELEVELVTAEDAALKPVGKGQGEPNQFPHLEPPKRPETSFLWFTSPFKTLKAIIWKNYKWTIITLLFVLLAVIFVALFIYNVPGATVNAIFG